jgi:hypothetical protein
LGIGPVRYFVPEEVEAHAVALAGVSLDHVRTLLAGDERWAQAEDLLVAVTRYYYAASERQRAMLLHYM